MPWAAPPVSPRTVTARPRSGIKQEFTSRWTPRYVWTLHRVPGRLDGPPLAVRRRVLSEGDAGYMYIETPGGDASVNGDDLSSVEGGGRARTTGSSRFDCRKEPPICGFFYGCDLEIDVFDHEPTEDERARWLEVRRRLSAMLKRTPKHAYLASPGEGRYCVEKVQIRRPDGFRDFGSRYDLDVRRPRGKWCAEICAPNLYDLAEQGWSSVGSRPGGVRLYLDPPPQAELKQLWREHAERVAQDARYKREAESFFNAFRRAVDPEAQRRAEGLDALRALGLDESATAADVQSAFRKRAKTEHPDQGGSGDMAELVRIRDRALGAVKGAVA
jgi:hypothetical protein